MTYSTDQIRNIALVGHSGAGKTELADALLHGAGKIPHKGSVDAGTTVSDSDAKEKEIKHSLKAGFCHFEHGGVHANLLDTPGHPDFVGRAVSVLPAVETAAVVVNAATGVETMTQRMMDAAVERHLCRMVIVNRIDAEGVNTAAILAQIQEAFGNECLPINLPVGGGAKVVDIFFHDQGGETDIGSVADAHEQIVDQVVEVDDDLMEVYLEEGEVAPEQLHDAFEKALRDGHLVPVCFVSAATGTGIAELLDVIAKLMPSPSEGNPLAFVTGPKAEPVSLSPDPEAHAVAHVVKVDIDPFRGRMAFLRVHQGVLRRGRQIFVGDARKPLKISHLLRLNGAEHGELEAVVCGDICAIPRAEELFFNAVLHDAHDQDDTRLESLALPEPMYGRAISAESDAQAQKANEALSVLCAEDPTLKLEQIPAMNETVLYGIGELHLRMALDEVLEKYNVKVATALPSIAYRETITAKADGHHRHKKQTGGAGQFGEVFLRVEPLPRSGGFEFVDQVVGGVIPSQFIPAVEKGVREVLQEGAISGYPLQDVRVTVYDGKHHSVDSKEIAFVQAGKRAFISAVQSAKPIVMEPVVDVSVAVPEHCMGDVAGDLSGMRGSVKGTNVVAGGRLEVLGQAPLKEVQDYHSRLNSLSGGEGSFAMTFSHYAPVPALDQQELVKAFRHDGE